jgi:hypothetical protein
MKYCMEHTERKIVQGNAKVTDTIALPQRAAYSYSPVMRSVGVHHFIHSIPKFFNICL